MTDIVTGGQRTWVQVFTNGGIPALYAAHFILETGFQDHPLDFSNYYNTTYIALGVMSGIACCSGDTWASEVGSVVGTESPRLITTLEKVPRGKWDILQTLFKKTICDKGILHYFSVMIPWFLLMKCLQIGTTGRIHWQNLWFEND